MATVNLGSIKFKWKGTYSGATAYTIDDVVEYNGSSYICILASTGNLPTNATYFEQMSSAGTNGTNGTDLGTTLTTQGDIVYRDGSGLQRLGAGTAGQVLQTGGAGANPSWGSVSSDFVHLGTVTIAGTPTTVSIDGYFSATYKHYKIMWDKVGGNNGYLSFRVNISGSANSSSNYYGNHHYSYVNSSGATSDGVYSAGWSGTRFELDNDNINGATVDRQTGEMHLFDPQNTTYSKSWHHRSQCFNGGANHFWQQTGGGQYTTNYSALTGVTFLYNNGAAFLSDGEFRIYGIKG